MFPPFVKYPISIETDRAIKNESVSYNREVEDYDNQAIKSAPAISNEKWQSNKTSTELLWGDAGQLRRFAKLEKSDVVNCTRRELVKKEKKQKKQEEPSTKAEEQKVQADRDRKKEEPAGKDQKEGSSPETKEMISATSNASSAHGEVERTSKSQAVQPKQKTGKSEREQKKKKTLLRNLGWGKKKERKKDRRK